MMMETLVQGEPEPRGGGGGCWGVKEQKLTCCKISPDKFPFVISLPTPISETGMSRDPDPDTTAAYLDKT